MNEGSHWLSGCIVFALRKCSVIVAQSKQRLFDEGQQIRMKLRFLLYRRQFAVCLLRPSRRKDVIVLGPSESAPSSDPISLKAQSPLTHTQIHTHVVHFPSNQYYLCKYLNNARKVLLASLFTLLLLCKSSYLFYAFFMSTKPTLDLQIA